MSDALQVNETVAEDGEERLFIYRITHVRDASLKVEVGDQYEVSPIFGSNYQAQIGVDLAMKAFRLMGLSHEESRLHCTLAMKTLTGD